MAGYDAVLFDNDGVLVTPTDRETLREAARSAFHAVGVDDPDPAHVDDIVLGVSVDDLEAICRSYDVSAEEFWRARDETAGLVQRVAMCQGRKRAYDDVDAVRSLSVPAGVVSTNQQRTVEFGLRQFGLADAFETVHARAPTVESLRRKKPNPHYVEAALSEVDVAPERALFVGDSESDVRAARRAGMDAAFLRRSHCEDLALRVEPTTEVDGLATVASLVAE